MMDLASGFKLFDNLQQINGGLVVVLPTSNKKKDTTTHQQEVQVGRTSRQASHPRPTARTTSTLADSEFDKFPSVTLITPTSNSIMTRISLLPQEVFK
jgi:hypothetical protein